MLAITPKQMELAVRPPTQAGLRSPPAKKKARRNLEEELTVGQLLQVTSVKGDLYTFREELRRREYPPKELDVAGCFVPDTGSRDP